MDYNFVEVMQNFDNMCNQYDYMCDVDECPIAAIIDNWEQANDQVWTRDCAYYATKYPEEFADVVMKWAEAHQYPTIGEIIEELCELMHKDKDTDIYEIWNRPLNEAAANYFNIKNGKLV